MRLISSRPMHATHYGPSTLAKPTTWHRVGGSGEAPGPPGVGPRARCAFGMCMFWAPQLTKNAGKLVLRYVRIPPMPYAMCAGHMCATATGAHKHACMPTPTPAAQPPQNCQKYPFAMGTQVLALSANNNKGQHPIAPQRHQRRAGILKLTAGGRI